MSISNCLDWVLPLHIDGPGRDNAQHFLTLDKVICASHHSSFQLAVAMGTDEATGVGVLEVVAVNLYIGDSRLLGRSSLNGTAVESGSPLSV